MKTLEQQMSFYLRYHRDPRNRLTHFFGVPLIIFSLLVAMSLVPIVPGPHGLKLSTIFLVIVLIYYFRLDLALGLAMTIFTGAMLYVAHLSVERGLVFALALAAVSFVIGWVLQLWGHHFEGKRPALVDNFFQVFVAPIFLMAEVFFALGYKRDIAARVEQLAAESSQGGA